MKTPLLDRFGLYAVIFMAAVLTAVAYIRFPVCYDDAYITFRYAQRIAQGLGFTYNDGVRSLGTTTPLFALILAGGASFFSPDHIPAMARLMGSLCFLASICLIYRIIIKLTSKSNIALLFAFLYATYPPSVSSSATGMEIPIFIAFMLLTYFLIIDGKTLPAGILTGLMLLIRPDAMVWAIALGCAILYGKTKLLKYISGFLAIALPSVLMITLYFGNPLPLSIIAKRVSYGPYFHLDYSNLLHVLVVFLPNRLAAHAGAVILIWGLLITIAAYVLHRSIGRKESVNSPAIAYMSLYPAFLWYGRTLMFEWYGYLLIPVILIVLAIAVSQALNAQRKFIANRIARAAGIILIVGWTILSFWRSLIFEPAFGQGGPGLVDLEQRALYFRDHTSPNAKIFTESIPQIGYISGRPIICEIGLVSPEVVKAKRKYGDKITENCKWYFDILREQKPEYLLLHAPDFDSNRLFPSRTADFLSDAEDSNYFFGNYQIVDVQEIINSGNYSGILPDRYHLFQRIGK